MSHNSYANRPITVSKLWLASTVNTFYITKAKYNLERF